MFTQKPDMIYIYIYYNKFTLDFGKLTPAHKTHPLGLNFRHPRESLAEVHVNQASLGIGPVNRQS